MVRIKAKGTAPSQLLKTLLLRYAMQHLKFRNLIPAFSATEDLVIEVCYATSEVWESNSRHGKALASGKFVVVN